MILEMKSESSEGGRVTAWVISAAVVLASVLFALGLAVFILQGGAEEPFRVRGILDVAVHAVRGSAHLQPRGFIEAGLLVLLFAPLARLFAGVVGSARRRSWLYVAIGILVMALLLAGILLGTR